MWLVCFEQVKKDSVYCFLTWHWLCLLVSYSIIIRSCSCSRYTSPSAAPPTVGSWFQHKTAPIARAFGGHHKLVPGKTSGWKGGNLQKLQTKCGRNKDRGLSAPKKHGHGVVILASFFANFFHRFRSMVVHHLCSSEEVHPFLRMPRTVIHGQFLNVVEKCYPFLPFWEVA